jgi:Mg/Co/Ni transporter MgtE
MTLDLLVFIAGVVYGYVSPGKEDKMKLLKKGLKIGVITGIVFGLLSFFMGGFLFFGATLIGFIIVIAIYTIIFIAGTIIGDFLETKLKK